MPKSQTGRVLGLDVGDVRIGVALSDATGSIASPLETIRIKVRDQAISQIADLVQEHEVEVVVVGLPVSLNGQIGPQARKVQDFCSLLMSRLRVPVITIDESYSTVDADRMLRDAKARRSRRKSLKDSAAAAVILQEYLEGRRRESLRADSSSASR